MPDAVFINEVTIPLEALQRLRVLKCLTHGLSTAHKQKLERALSDNHSCIAIFEGEVLFSMPTTTESPDVAARHLLLALETELRNSQSLDISSVELRQAPERIVERFTFALLSYVAARRSIYTLFGRTFFKPTKSANKKAHKILETSLMIEDGSIKLLLTPSYIALTELSATHRSELSGLDLVQLCRFRSDCDLANQDGSCPYVRPGSLGYYESEVSYGDMESDSRIAMERRFKGCPKLSSDTDAVLVRATKKASKVYAYPKYVVQIGLGRTDLQADPTLAKKYRNATLMWSGVRYRETMTWLRDLFGITDIELNSGSIQLNLGAVSIPLTIGLSKGQRVTDAQKQGYKAIWIPEQPIICEQKDYRKQSLGGGWLFLNNGAYDRSDPKRPFERVKPYVIAPQESSLATTVRGFLEVMSDGQYESKPIPGDKPFLGLNTQASLEKYNSPFENVWNDEEDVHLIEEDDAAYLAAAQDVIRDWNGNSKSKDQNRVALVFIPPSPTGFDEDNALYYKLKKLFLEEGIPSQFITLDTIRGLSNPSVAFGPVLHSLWLNIYAKLGGKPWRLANQLGNVHCFIGVGFGLNPREMGNHIYAGVAHVFDKHGSWLDLASNWHDLSTEERANFESTQRYMQGTSSFKISETVTGDLVYDALKLYQRNQTVTGEPAHNIVLHKLGQVYECEIVGFLEGVRRTLGTLDQCRLGILEIQHEHQTRLYAEADRPNSKEDRTVYRGTGLIFNSSRMALATTGRTYRQTSKSLYTNYPGIGTPNPLVLRNHVPSGALLKRYGCRPDQFYDIETMGRYVMALTQLHWGSTKDNVLLPITALYAQRVADLVSKTGARVDTWLKHHGPWFL